MYFIYVQSSSSITPSQLPFPSPVSNSYFNIYNFVVEVAASAAAIVKAVLHVKKVALFKPLSTLGI